MHIFIESDSVMMHPAEIEERLSVTVRFCSLSIVVAREFLVNRSALTVKVVVTDFNASRNDSLQRCTLERCQRSWVRALLSSDCDFYQVKQFYCIR